MKIIHMAIISLLVVCAIFLSGSSVSAQENPVRSAEEILAGQETNPSREAIRELFINGSSRDERHAPVAAGCKQALINLGMAVIPALLEDYLSSDDLLFGIALDQIIGAAGHPATEFLIPYLESSDSYTRRSAAYLIGMVSAASRLEDPLALGPLDDDLPAINTLKAALAVEQDWHAVRPILEALGAMRDPEMVELIAGYLKNEEQAVRLSAVAALSRIPTPGSASYLASAFSDEEMTVRESAVLALSTPIMGKLAIANNLFQDRIRIQESTRIRLCSLEAYARYLEAIASDTSNDAVFAREQAAMFRSIIESELDPGDWQTRGYIVQVLGFTYIPDVMEYLQNLRQAELHPFVLQKIDEALLRLEAGQPQPVE
ncbi:MAG: HEAT repeat domain-containing protein [bacterium]|nr:HEAT repeat domain-containing protein [bacterium]